LHSTLTVSFLDKWHRLTSASKRYPRTSSSPNRKKLKKYPQYAVNYHNPSIKKIFILHIINFINISQAQTFHRISGFRFFFSLFLLLKQHAVSWIMDRKIISSAIIIISAVWFKVYMAIFCELYIIFTEHMCINGHHHTHIHSRNH
jgi:hypothetical protein